MTHVFAAVLAGADGDAMRKWFVLLAVVALAAGTGCVERALVITSEPTGADITVNQQWKGKTPFIVPFKHYGVYDIWIEHPGYEENGRMVKFYPLHVGEPVKAPGYQMAGADFVSEVLLPTTLRDQHNLHYILERVDKADDVTDVLARAQQLREASEARTRMRYEKDVQRGRDPYPTTVVVTEEDGTLYEYEGVPDMPDVEYDLAPPLPREMPIFAE